MLIIRQYFPYGLKIVPNMIKFTGTILKNTAQQNNDKTFLKIETSHNRYKAITAII